LQRNEAFVQHSQNVSRLCALVGRLTSVGTTATLVLSHRDLLQIDPHALRAATDLFPHVAAHAKFVVTNYFRNRVERLESEDETDIRLLTLLNTALIRLSVLYSF
jgi:hypothetical protein